MASRKISDCVPELQSKFRIFKKKMQEAGIDFILTCTTRTKEEQEKLYQQGRTLPGRKVTWTLTSKHITGKAFDIVIMRDGKPVWDLNADTNNDNLSDWIEAGTIGESCGLTWGGKFHNVDMPHFEVS